MALFIHNNNCDVVVSLVSPFKELREDFKDKLGVDIVEIYTHTTEKKRKIQIQSKRLSSTER